MSYVNLWQKGLLCRLSTLADLKYRREIGQCVHMSVLDRVVGEVASLLQQHLTSMPDRIDDQLMALAAAGDAVGFKDAHAREIQKSLRKVAEQAAKIMERLADEYREEISQ